MTFLKDYSHYEKVRCKSLEIQKELEMIMGPIRDRLIVIFRGRKQLVKMIIPKIRLNTDMEVLRRPSLLAEEVLENL